MPTIWVNISFILFQVLMLKTIYAKAGSSNSNTSNNNYTRIVPPRYSADNAEHEETGELPSYEEPPSYEETVPLRN